MRRVVCAAVGFAACLTSIGVMADDGGTDAAVPPEAGVDAAIAPPPPKPDAEPPEPPTPVLADQEQHALAKGIRVLVNPPYGWEGQAGDELAPAELEQIPGAVVSLSRVWIPSDKIAPVRPRVAESARMNLICATAPSTDWAPGMESLVFERLNVIAREELGKHMVVSSFAPSTTNESGAVFWQNFAVQGSPGAARKEGSVRVLEVDQLGAKGVVLGEGRHIIGFSAEPDQVLVCSLVCVEPVGRRYGTCSAALGSFRLDGTLAPEPLPSTTGKLLLGVRRRPLMLVGAAIGLLISLVGALMVLRGLMLKNASRRTAPAG